MEAQNTQPGAELKTQADTAKMTAPVSTPQVSTQFTASTDLSGVERSAIYRINADNTVETLWSSKDENAYDLLALPNQLLFSTDTNGRIYGLSRDRKITLVMQTNEGEATRLLPAENSVLVATGDMGRIYRLGEVPGGAGYYESPVHDAGTASRWGSLSWRAELASGSTLLFRTRSGNSAKPDKTWSDWSGPLTDSARFPHRQPECPLHPVEGRIRRQRRRHPDPRQRHPGLPAAEFSAAGEEHQRHFADGSGLGLQGIPAAGHLALHGHRQRYRRHQHLIRRRHPYPNAVPRRRPADHHQLAGRGSRWRPSGL